MRGLSILKRCRQVLRPSRKTKIANLIDAYCFNRFAQDQRRVLEFNPSLEGAYQHIDARTESTSKHIYRRAADLIEWLENRRPRCIMELGLGRSSLIFSTWAAQAGITHVAFEENSEWQAVVTEAISMVGGRSEVRQVPTIDVLDQGRKYSAPLPADTDFIYLDGPSGMKPRRFNTMNGEALFFDVPHHLEASHRPATILVDGRVSTVLYISGMMAASDYNRCVSGSVVKNIMHDNVELATNRHTSFILKPR